MRSLKYLIIWIEQKEKKMLYTSSAILRILHNLTRYVYLYMTKDIHFHIILQSNKLTRSFYVTLVTPI